MNLFELQERLKDFSQDQLVREMQAPTGMAPQYLVLSELQRRQRMMAEQQAQMPEDQTTVAEDAIAAAGVPQGGLADMAQAMAPQTDMDMNTAAQPVERMQDGGAIAMRPPRIEDQAEPMSREELAAARRGRLAQDALEEALAMMESSPAGAGRNAISRILQQVAPEGYAAASDAPGRGLDEDGGIGALAILPALLARRRGVDLTKYPSLNASRMADGGVVRMQPGGVIGDPLAPYVQHLNQTYTAPKIESFVENVRNMEQREFGQQSPGTQLAASGPLSFGPPPSQFSQVQPAPPLTLNASDPYDGMRGFGVMMDNPLQVQQRQADLAAANQLPWYMRPPGMNERPEPLRPPGTPSMGGIFARQLGASRMADGGVVRMQPGGLAGISRDLGAYSPTMGGARAIPSRRMEDERARLRRAEIAAAAEPLLRFNRDGTPNVEGFAADLAALGIIPDEEMLVGEGLDPRFYPTEGRLAPIGETEEDYEAIRQGAPLSARPDILMDLVPEPEVTPFPSLIDPDLPSGYRLNRILFPGEDPEETLRRLQEAQRNRTDDGATAVDELSGLPTDMAPEGSGDVSPDGALPPITRAEMDEIDSMREARRILTSDTAYTLPAETRDTDTGSDTGSGVAAPAMDDAFEQDKWLALAQAGLSLMSSQQPTLGGAIGEAGLAGITALRQARGERDERLAAQQARADRLAAAAASAARRQNEDAYPYRQVDDIIAMADSYAQAAASIVEDNFGTAPVEGDPNYDQYINSLAMANVLRRRALALTGLE